MWKYIAQWAVQGVLFLVGLGVDVMPGNTSWIPSVIIWGIALSWLIVTIIYYIKHRRKTDNRIGSLEQGGNTPLVKESKTKPVASSVSIGDLLYAYSQKCSQCGFGIKVNVLDRVVTCPKCGNVDNVVCP